MLKAIRRKEIAYVGLMFVSVKCQFQFFVIFQIVFLKFDGGNGSDRLTLEAMHRKESMLMFSLGVSSKFNILGVKFLFQLFVRF